MDDTTQKVFRAVVSFVEESSTEIKKITFTINENFVFLPGQYVWVEIPEMKNEDLKGNRRAFSICNIQNKENNISIIARKGISGYKKSLFSLVSGDKVVIHGPFGSTFTLDEKNKNNIVMIAGGVGISPFLPIIESLCVNSSSLKCFLVYLNKNKDDTPFLPLLEKFKKENNNFDYIVKYEFFSWEDVKDVDVKENYKWWVSGPQAMVDHVYRILIMGKIYRSNMCFENYYPTPQAQLSFYEEIREQLKRESLLIPAVQDSVTHTVITDTNGIILFVNKAAEKITGYSQEEMLGNTPRLWGGMMSPKFYKDFWEHKFQGKAFEGKIINRRKNGELYYVKTHITPVLNKKKEIIGFIGTEDDITDLEQLNKSKTEFVSIASHQLRTPLTAINWYVEMLESGDVGTLTPEQKKYLDEINKGSVRMVKLVNDLLNVSRIETGRLKIEPEMTDISSMIDDVVKEVMPWSTSLGCEVVFEKSNNVLEKIPVDVTLLYQVVHNIITNAVRYSSKDKSSVVIKLEKKDEDYVVSVVDKGIGIPLDARDKIFDKFFRAENARSFETDGSGIGMYISKSIMDACGGKLWFVSPTNFKMVDGKEVGYGTTFYVSIPVSGMKGHIGEKSLS